MKKIGPVVMLMALAGCVGSSDDRPLEVKAAAAAAPATAGVSTQDAAERAAYLSKVELRTVKSEPFTSRMDAERKASVSVELKNTGDRTLSQVQVTIYFLDKHGKRVHEDTAHPVLDSQFATDSSPLRPNYARKWSGGYDVPSDWAGKVEAKVTDVRFAR